LGVTKVGIRIYKKYVEELPFGTQIVATGYTGDDEEATIKVYMEVSHINDDDKLVGKILKVHPDQLPWTKTITLSSFNKFYLLTNKEKEWVLKQQLLVGGREC